MSRNGIEINLGTAAIDGTPHSTGVDIGSARRGSPSGCWLFRQCFEMTRHPLTAFEQPKLGFLHPAAVEHEWTSCVEAASAGWIDRARHVALQDHRRAGGPGRRYRHGREQGFGVGMLRSGEDLLP